MNTAYKISQPVLSDENNPEYSIPNRILLKTPINSERIESEPESSSSADINENSANRIPKLAGVVQPFVVQLKGKFQLLQLWEGRIVEVRDSEFDAIIKDKTNPEFVDELVTIGIIEVTPDDVSLVTEGAVFYWSVGYLDYPGRGRIRESKLRFRRLRGWTKKEIEHAKRVGKEFAEFFESNSVCSSQT